MPRLLLLLFLGALLSQQGLAQERFDADALLRHVEVLAADSMAGRKTGTEGGRRARAYLESAYGARGLQPFGRTFARPFHLGGVRGTNVVGYLPGTVHPDRYIVLSAHYDHVGTRRGSIYNGADDNASGVAALLAAAEYFSEHPPEHTLVFAAFDAEEAGLLGAQAFLEDPPVAPERFLLNVNLDMVSRSEAGELYAAGTYHYPALRPALERVARRSEVRLLLGHDRPELGPRGDWTLLSDHAVFHRAGIPFVYFGVEDHADYHQPTDDYGRIHPDFFVMAVSAILDAVAELDAHWPGGGER